MAPCPPPTLLLPQRPDLVGVLKSQFAAARTFSRQSSDVKKGKAKKNDDYENFMDEMSDIL